MFCYKYLRFKTFNSNAQNKEVTKFAPISNSQSFQEAFLEDFLVERQGCTSVHKPQHEVEVIN